MHAGIQFNAKRMQCTGSDITSYLQVGWSLEDLRVPYTRVQMKGNYDGCLPQLLVFFILRQ